MKLIEGKCVKVTEKMIKEAICNIVFKGNPDLRNRSELPEVILINNGGIVSTGAPIAAFEAKVLLEKKESDLIKNEP